MECKLKDLLEEQLYNFLSQIDEEITEQDGLLDACNVDQF